MSLKIYNNFFSSCGVLTELTDKYIDAQQFLCDSISHL